MGYFNTYMDKINEIINDRSIEYKCGVMVYIQPNGNRVEFNKEEDKPSWKSLKEQDNYMYNAIVDEIFDELHPY